MLTHRILSYLIGLAVGYWVLTHADKQKGNTQKIGKGVAWLIMAVSLIGLLCLAACSMKCRTDSAACHSGRWSCPMDKDGSMMGRRGMMEGEGMKGEQDMMEKKDKK